VSINRFFDQVKESLDCNDPDLKVIKVHQLARRSRGQELILEHDSDVLEIAQPGRPEKPELVLPRDLPQRKPNTIEGRAVLFHAITHIEFNAINLALDAAYRFRNFPDQYYDDWIKIAEEEAYHFTLLRAHLRMTGFDYGDFPAHNGLWEMAQKTAFDPMVRMALVPRCLEARGLDVNPTIKNKLLKAGDHNGATLLDIILHDEIGHVAIGNHWFQYICKQRKLDYEQTYMKLLDEYMDTPLRPPFHMEARKQAGFSENEIAYLEGVG
jgi:uncharacterized ferritin-like protein (DUF455 family)